MNTFDWSLVRSFLAALEQGSLLGAARELQMSQPTIGRHIAELESQMGTVLFERTGRGLVPTRMALRVADDARSMEASALRMSRALSGKQVQAAGTVRLASVPVAVKLLPPILAQMRESLPDVQVELVSSNQVSNLLRREADIAIRMVRPAQSTLIARKIGDVTIVACAHSHYLESATPITRATDLLQHRLIGSDTDKSILQGFAAMGYPVAREQFAFRCDDFMAQWQAVRAGLGVGFVADYMLHEDPDVVPVLVEELRIPPLPMWLAVHREIRTSKLIRAVYDHLAEALPRAMSDLPRNQ